MQWVVFQEFDLGSSQEFRSQLYGLGPDEFQVYSYRHFFMENRRRQSVAMGEGYVAAIIHRMGFTMLVLVKAGIGTVYAFQGPFDCSSRPLPLPSFFGIGDDRQ